MEGESDSVAILKSKEILGMVLSLFLNFVDFVPSFLPISVFTTTFSVAARYSCFRSCGNGEKKWGAG